MADWSQRVELSRDPGGRWEMAEAAPAVALRGLVHGYTGFVETAGSPLRRREVPSGVVTLVINLGVPLAIAVPGSAATPYPGSFLARISSLPAVTEFTGTSAGIEVRLTPLGAHMLLDLPMDELPEPAVDLGDLLGPGISLLAEQLDGLESWEARIERIDEFVLERFAAARAPRPSVEWAWRALVASRGRVPIGRLSERLGCSRAHLIRGFRDQVGVTPKTAAAILRFNRAAALLRQPDGAARRAAGAAPSLAAVAADCGYHDQSHMTREFRRFAGTTPRVYASAWCHGYLGLPEDEVNFVQDSAAVRS